MRLFRCKNPKHGPNGLDFEADPATCKCACGWEWSDARIQGTLLTELVILHFDPPSGIPGRGMRYLACDANVVVGVLGHRATGVPSVVNCPLCKATEAYKVAASGGDPVLDIPKAVESFVSARDAAPTEK